MQKVVLLVFIFLVVVSNSNAAETNQIRVTSAPNPWLEVSFVRKEKTKRDGWLIYLRFTNKTKKPIYGLSTWYDLREGAWKVGSNHISVSNTDAILPANQSRVHAWMMNVPSSVDEIHISEIEPRFR